MKSTSLPIWLPASKVPRTNITPVAWFVYDFNTLVSQYKARPSTDRDGGGAGPVKYFFISLGHGRIAEFSHWDSKPGYVELSLKVNSRGVVYWEDFEDALIPIQIPVEEVRRQGAFHWRRRGKTPATEPPLE